jgi:hypothetical protein
MIKKRLNREGFRSQASWNVEAFRPLGYSVDWNILILPLARHSGVHSPQVLQTHYRNWYRRAVLLLLRLGVGKGLYCRTLGIYFGKL